MRKRKLTATGEPVVTNPKGNPATQFGAEAGPPVVVERRVWSTAETAAHMAFVESLMMTPGMSDTRAIELCRQQHHFSVGRFRTLKKRVQAAWLVQDEGERPTVRAAAIRRIMSMLFFARGQRNADGRTWERPPNHSAIRGYESLLADLQGTRAPIQVNVNHEISSALTDVIGNLTPEQLQEALDEWNAMEQLANEAKQLRAAE